MALTQQACFDDCYYFPNFLTELGYDSQALGEQIRTLPFADRGASHMRYRGHELKRSKFFYVDSLKQVPIYSYPGFQHRSVLEEYKLIEEQPQLNALRMLIREVLGYETNHVIGTLYKDEKDTIGYHDDKIKTIDEKVPIFIFSFLQQRPLSFRHNMTGAVTEVPMKPGSLFVMGHETNKHYQHAILPTKTPLNERVSVIFRKIKNLVSIDEVKKKAKI